MAEDPRLTLTGLVSTPTGTGRPQSDVALGVLCEENEPFKIEVLRNLATRLNDLPNGGHGIYEWGR
jgi:hypothetical protein